jgi:hypothetical protein
MGGGGGGGVGPGPHVIQGDHFFGVQGLFNAYFFFYRDHFVCVK